MYQVPSRRLGLNPASRRTLATCFPHTIPLSDIKSNLLASEPRQRRASERLAGVIDGYRQLQPDILTDSITLRSTG